MSDLSAKVQNYLNEINTGKLKTNNALVLDKIMREGVTTVHELRFYFDHTIPHQTLTSRIDHLLDCGVIEIKGKVTIDDKPYSQLEFVSNKIRRRHNQSERRKQKFDKWRKRGLRDFGNTMTPELKFQLECYDND